MPGPQAATIAGPATMSRWEALRAVGWWKPFDWVIVFAVLSTWITVFFWWVFGNPTASKVIIVLLVNMGFVQIWTVMLSFRCSDFILNTRADINLLPHAAARIAVGYLSGGGGGTPSK
jgi:hypothetical protein